MRSRSRPHRGTTATRVRSRGEARALTPPPDPWTDRDFAFHVRESLRRRAYMPSAEAKRERDASDWGFGPATRGWNERQRAMLPSDAVATSGYDPRLKDRGHADTSLRDEIAHRIVAEAGDAGLDVTIRVLEGIVTLDGPVPERVTKEMLQAIVEACPGVRGVDNRLRVDWIDETPRAARATEAPREPGRDYLRSTNGSSTSTMKRTG